MRMRRADLMRTEGIKAFSNGYSVVVWTGENDTKPISVDAKLFKNGAKQLRFRLKRISVDGALLWTGFQGSFYFTVDQLLVQ